MSHSKLGWWRADQDRSILSLSGCRTGRLQTNRSPPSRMFGVKSITSLIFNLQQLSVHTDSNFRESALTLVETSVRLIHGCKIIDSINFSGG